MIDELFGNWFLFMKECEIIPFHYNKTITKEEVDEEIQKVFKKVKDNRKMFDGRSWTIYSKMNISTVIKYYGNKVSTLISSIEEIKEYNDVDKERLINEMNRVEDVCKMNGKNLSNATWTLYAGQLYKRCFSKHYNTFTEAMLENGFINQRTIPNPTKQDIIDESLRIYEKHGYLSSSLLVCESKYRSKSLKLISEEYENFFDFVESLNIVSNHKKINKSSKQVIDYVSKILNEDPILEYSWPWLKNDKKYGFLKVDAYFKNNNFVVEYNGIQHYEHNNFFHKTLQDFESQVNNDKLKIKLLKDHDIKILVFPYYDFRKQNLEDIVNNKVKEVLLND